MSIYKEINISDIQPNLYQPRTNFDDEQIQLLAQSIQENGLIQPITVRETDNGYQIVAGERRYRACKLLGQNKIKAIVINVSQIKAANLAIIENIQREDLSPIEEANAYQEIMRLAGMTQQELAVKIGKSQSNIANKLRLLNLDDEVQEALKNKLITERHGRSLLALPINKQKEALQQILSEQLNVTETEKFVTKENKKKKRRTKCIGVASKIVINSLKKAVNDIKKYDNTIEINEQDSDDSYIMTIRVKK